MTLEDAVRLLIPEGELGDAVHEGILACAKQGLIRIKEDGTLVLTEDGRKAVEQGADGSDECDDSG
jgi:predicted RecA/RadA family phage recombinase